MKLPLLLSNGEYLEFKPGLPVGFKGHELSGADTTYVKTNTVSIASQVINTDRYNIRFILARFLEKIKTTGRFEVPGLYVRFQLRNSQRHWIGHKTKLHLRQDQCSGMWMMDGECSSLFMPNEEYQSLDIFVSEQLLNEFLPIFPGLKNIIEQKAVDWLPGKICWILPPVRQVLDDLIYCPFDAATTQLYYDLKVRELLTHLLHYRFNRTEISYTFSPWEMKKISDARELLQQYISDKAPTLRSLAQQVNINAVKLKHGFLHMYNCTIFDWLLEARMKKAKDLLITTDEPIKEVCKQVGYPRVSNFITAFRRRFGYTPGSLRRY